MKTALYILSFLSVMSLSAQMNGTYIIGSSPSDFPSLQDARDSIFFGGTSGPVTLTLKPGNYTSTLPSFGSDCISALWILFTKSLWTKFQ